MFSWDVFQLTACTSGALAVVACGTGLIEGETVFGISGFEFAMIVLLVLVIFGPDKLPEIARTAGKAIRMFKTAQADMERLIRIEMLTGGDRPIDANLFGSTGNRPKAETGGTATSSPMAPMDSASSGSASAAEIESAAESVWNDVADDRKDEEDEE